MGTPANLSAHPSADRRPKRATDVRDLINVVTQYNLARSHRTVLLLADGEHTVQDISRLSGKPVEDVVQLLRDLEERRLVFYPA
jgi:ethanolamine utilization protein EutP (predicted NTPase)